MTPLDLSHIESLAGLIDRGLSRFGPKVALIEADRDHPAKTYTYDDFSRVSRSIAGMISDSIGPGDHAAILMSNQSRWLFCASAVFFRGAVLVPLDYKLGPQDQLALLAHSAAKVAFVEWPIYQRWIRENHPIPEGVRILVSDAPEKQEIPHERFERSLERSEEHTSELQSH